jgi:hypothetical protein
MSVETIAIVAVVGLVVVVVAQTVSTFVLVRSGNGRLAAQLRFLDHQRQEIDAMAGQLLEKAMTDPRWAAGLHSRERMASEELAASLERESIRQEKSTPPEALDPDGVPTDNLDEARYR